MTATVSSFGSPTGAGLNPTPPTATPRWMSQNRWIFESPGVGPSAGQLHEISDDLIRAIAAKTIETDRPENTDAPSAISIQNSTEMSGQGSLLALLMHATINLSAEQPRDPWTTFEQLAGTVTAPSDFASHHDKYLYGVDEES